MISSNSQARGKSAGRGFKRKWGRQSNGSGKKLNRKSSLTNGAKSKGSQYNSVVSGGNTGRKTNDASGSKGNYKSETNFF